MLPNPDMFHAPGLTLSPGGASSTSRPDGFLSQAHINLLGWK